MEAIYLAVMRFDPSCGERWRSFIEWSGLTGLREVISLDGILCPDFVQELTDEDWQHNVHEDFKAFCFRDLDYLVAKVAANDQVNILALMQEPTALDVASFVDDRFVFRGFDLVEVNGGGISALLNCGGFDKAFSKSDLTECGLLFDIAKARSVQRLLREYYPDEHHADCDVWAIWQMTPNPAMDRDS